MSTKVCRARTRRGSGGRANHRQAGPGAWQVSSDWRFDALGRSSGHGRSGHRLGARCRVQPHLLHPERVQTCLAYGKAENKSLKSGWLAAFPR